MRIYKAKNYDEMSRQAANVISAQVIMKPNCVLGLATGSSPLGTYKQLIDWNNKGDLDFSGVKTVNLDEYKGLTKENDQSYYYFMYNNLFKHINIDLKNTNIPDGTEPDSAIDSEFAKMTHCVDLTESTIEANKRFFASIDDVPRQAYTMGIKTIMQAKKILLIASGADKARILREALCGPVTPQVPASILQLHNDVIVVADEAAMAEF